MAKAKTQPATDLPYRLFTADCLQGIPQRLKKGQAKLAACDPPYNIGQAYHGYADRKAKQEYLDFMRKRVGKLVEYVHPEGSVWIAINDDNVSELDVICKEELGLFPRRKVIWYFTFGQNHPRSLTQSHVTWLYYSKHRTKFTFNADDPLVRIPSARQLEYNDKRANPRGRLPDDTWILRPQQLPEAWHELSSSWYFSRLCGTFRAKVKEDGVPIPNQMPVAMMERIVRLCSNPGDEVVDVFNGTATTGEACLLTGRRYTGFDVSQRLIEISGQRLAEVYGRVLKGQYGDPDQLGLFDGKDNTHGKVPVRRARPAGDRRRRA